MAKHGYGQSQVDTYVSVEQRSALCSKCGSNYHGPKLEVECRGCGKLLQTKDVGCKKIIATGVWFVSNAKQDGK
ncbi:MAG: hypothetical protein ACXVCY_04335 [Pseudobdellovibrionaceae bacterium]